MAKETLIIGSLIAALGGVFYAMWFLLPTWGLALYLRALAAVMGALWRSGK